METHLLKLWWLVDLSMSLSRLVHFNLTFLTSVCGQMGRIFMVSSLTKEEFSKSIRYGVELNPAYFQIVAKFEGLLEADT